MSVKGFTRDLMFLSVIISLIIVSGFTLYNYFTTYDTNFLIWGLIAVILTVFSAISRYRFLIDYVWTLFKRWR